MKYKQDEVTNSYHLFQTNTKQPKKENEEAKCLLTKTNVISVMPNLGTEKPEEKSKPAVVAGVIAWYINPAIYVVFSVVYFIIGPYY